MADTRPPAFRGSFSRGERERVGASAAAGIFRAVPDAVAVPLDTADVSALLRWCADAGLTIVPRGAATGMPGGNLGGGVAVDLRTHFRRILQIDAEARTACVEPGVTLAELNSACARHGLRFAVDPSSGERCTIGGMLANNAAGPHTVRYGATRAWSEALDVVLATGERTRLQRHAADPEPIRPVRGILEAVLEPERAAIARAWPRVRKNSSGYALHEFLQSGDTLDLIVGSEGTLAAIVAAQVRLQPIPPARGLALLELAELDAAAAAVAALLELEPATCEILDRSFLDLVRSAGVDTAVPLRAGLEALLLVEAEGADEAEVGARLSRIQTELRQHAERVLLVRDPALQASCWAIRRAASPIIQQRADGRVSMQFIEDGVVPVERLADYIRALRRILADHATPAVVFGHAGDGNLHVNPLVDVRSPGWRSSVEAILDETTDVVAALGGTLAGEHGDGRLRAPLLERIWGAEMVARFRAVKQVFDPAGILNPGVVLPLPGQRPLDALRSFEEEVAHSPIPS